MSVGLVSPADATVPDRGFARLITNLSISGRFQGAREPPPRVTAGSVHNRPPDDRFESRRRPPPPTGLRPGEQVIDRTEAVGNPVLPAVTDEHEPVIGELCATLRAGAHRFRAQKAS